MSNVECFIKAGNISLGNQTLKRRQHVKIYHYDEIKVIPIPKKTNYIPIQFQIFRETYPQFDMWLKNLLVNFISFWSECSKRQTLDLLIEFDLMAFYLLIILLPTLLKWLLVKCLNKEEQGIQPSSKFED